MSDSERSWCSKLHLQGLELLYEEGTYRSFVEFRGHYEMPWEVFRRWENKWPMDLLLRDEFLAELEGGKVRLGGGSHMQLEVGLRVQLHGSMCEVSWD